MNDPYEILGLTSSASDEEISRTYRALAKRYHPDLNPGSASAEAQMRRVNEAYESIKTLRASGNRQNADPNYRANTYRAQNAGQNPYGQGYSGAYGQNTYGEAGFDPFADLYRNAQNFNSYRAAQYGGVRRRRPFNLIKWLIVLYLARWVISIIAQLAMGGGIGMPGIVP